MMKGSILRDTLPFPSMRINHSILLSNLTRYHALCSTLSKCKKRNKTRDRGQGLTICGPAILPRRRTRRTSNSLRSAGGRQRPAGLTLGKNGLVLPSFLWHGWWLPSSILLRLYGRHHYSTRWLHVDVVTATIASMVIARPSLYWWMRPLDALPSESSPTLSSDQWSAGQGRRPGNSGRTGEGAAQEKKGRSRGRHHVVPSSDRRLASRRRRPAVATPPGNGACRSWRPGKASGGGNPARGKWRRLQGPGKEPLLSSLSYGLTTALGPNDALCMFFPLTCNFTFCPQISIYFFIIISIYLHALVYSVLHVYFEALDYSILTPRLDTTL